jgi:hypothetical protein
MNENSGTKDPHIYAGSLLASVFGLLDSSKAEALVATAGEMLADARLGVRTVAPTDFHTDSLIAFFRLAGNEAGRPYSYANGGIWPHTTAWYIHALAALGKTDSALKFFERTMTVDGIAKSPRGIPAMYEYRYADVSSPEYGSIDKPSFLWAGGKYLEVLYRLFGVLQNPWNISFVRPPEGFDTVRYSLAFGRVKDVIVLGRGSCLESLTVDGDEMPSTVLPAAVRNGSTVRVQWGILKVPFVSNVFVATHTQFVSHSAAFVVAASSQARSGTPPSLSGTENVKTPSSNASSVAYISPRTVTVLR